MAQVNTLYCVQTTWPPVTVFLSSNYGAKFATLIYYSHNWVSIDFSEKNGYIVAAYVGSQSSTMVFGLLQRQSWNSIALSSSGQYAIACSYRGTFNWSSYDITWLQVNAASIVLRLASVSIDRSQWL